MIFRAFWTTNEIQAIPIWFYHKQSTEQLWLGSVIVQNLIDYQLGI